MKKIYLLLISILVLSASQTNAQCIADYQYFTTQNSLTVQFVDSSSYSPSSTIIYDWYFGDGNTSNAMNPSHTYSQAGTYYACLIIYDTLNTCFDSTCYSITVTSANPQPCNASFTYSVGQNNVVSFVSSVTPNSAAYTYQWNLGDGSTSTLANPIHTYAPGSYGIILYVTSSTGVTCSYFDSLVVNSSNPQPCNAFFNYNLNGNNGVQFYSSVTPSSGAPFSYSWDFGDGTSTNPAANPWHTYSNPGAYGVTLNVTASNGSTCSYYDTVYVSTCNSYFIPTVGSNGTVSFNNQSSPSHSQVNFSWNFGDGNFSNATNPTHTYTSSGTYTVTLSSFDSLTNCFSSYSDSINVQIGNPSSCNASYTIAIDSSAQFKVILYNTSSNFASHFYSWDFGDGTTGSGRTPLHQYQSFGSYIVCLTITDSLLNCTSTFCDTVGMDSLGNLKAGFGIEVQDPVAVGIDEEDQTNAITIFPNPAVNTISVDLRSVENRLNLQVLDITGKVVLENKNQVVGNVETLDISNLNKGIYFMILNDGASQKIEKFIKH